MRIESSITFRRECFNLGVATLAYVVKTLSLADWIRQVGEKEIARLFKISESAVGHWKRGLYLPNTECLVKIVKLSKGAVTYQEMIETYHNSKKAQS